MRSNSVMYWPPQDIHLKKRCKSILSCIECLYVKIIEKGQTVVLDKNVIKPEIFIPKMVWHYGRRFYQTYIHSDITLNLTCLL